MQYDPKLKVIMEEIKAVLDRHDIAAFILLESEPGFAEFHNRVDPSYSCAYKQKEELRFKLVTADIGKEDARRIAIATLSMIGSFAQILGEHALAYMNAEKLLTDQWKMIYPGGTISGNEQQNN